MTEYFDSIDILYAKEIDNDISDMPLYEKKNVTVGFVDPTDFLPIGANIVIRTLKSDTETRVDNDFYILLGVNGEVYPLKKHLFDSIYEKHGEPYSYETNYAPTIRTNLDDKVFNLEDYAKTCTPRHNTFVYARELDHAVKVFPLWNEEEYILGNPGDYLVRQRNNPKDVYIIPRDTFNMTYTLYEQ